MTLTIGRVTLESGPYDIRHDGDRLSFGVEISAASTGGVLEVAQMMRRQLLGLAGNEDDPVVPVTWTGDSDFDGFYRVAGVRVDPLNTYLETGRMQGAVDLERISGGYGDPLHELWAVLAKVNDTEFSFTATDRADSAVYLPASFPSQSERPGVSSRTAADGVAISEVTYSLLVGESMSFAWTHLATPAAFYDAGVKVEQLISGVWFDVIGRQVPAQSTLRVSNELVRVSVASDGEVNVESWDGSAWRSKLYRVTYDSGAGNITAMHAAVVRINGPDECVVSWIGVTDDDGGATISARLLRGELVAEVSVSSNAAQVWKLTRSTTEAATAVEDNDGADVGVRATANDANGDRFLILSREDLGEGSPDLTNGGWTMGITLDPITGSGLSSTSALWGVGLEVGGSGASAPNDEATMAERFQVVRSVVRSVST